MTVLFTVQKLLYADGVMMMEPAVETTYEFRSSATSGVSSCGTDEPNSCSELSATVIASIEGLVSEDSAAGTD